MLNENTETATKCSSHTHTDKMVFYIHHFNKSTAELDAGQTHGLAEQQT